MNETTPLEKSTVKQYFGCRKCAKKMETIQIGKESFDSLFGFGGTSKVLYCDNKDCDLYALLTVAGIKKSE